MALARSVALSNPTDRYKIGAVIVDKKGNVLASSANKMKKTHPLQASYAAKAGEEDKIYLHAEIAAISRLPRSSAIPHAIYIARVRKDGSDGMAAPCPICQMALEEAGITNVYYTED